MGRHMLVTMTLSLADDQSGSKGGNTRTYMNHEAAGKIERTESADPSSDSPYPVSERCVHER